MSETHKSTPYPSEIEPTQICFYSACEEKELNSSDIRYIVRGTVFVIDINTMMDFTKEFGDLSDARQYFYDVKNIFPLSEIILQKSISTNIKAYS